MMLLISSVQRLIPNLIMITPRRALDTPGSGLPLKLADLVGIKVSPDKLPKCIY
jgi:hypothetical protein